MTQDLAAWAKANAIRYFLIGYTDLFGGQRAKMVPAQAIADMQAEGAGFAGFASWLDLTPAHPDLFAFPDADAATPLPWKPGVAWIPADVHMDDAPLAQVPRQALKAQVAAAAELGLRVKTGSRIPLC